MYKCFLFAAVFMAVLAPTGPAHAYLDPGTGSMILQVLLGAIVGILVTGKLYWTKIKGFFSRKSDLEPPIGNPPIEK